MNSPVELEREATLQWDQELGVGFLDVEPPPDLYGERYFQHYRALDETRVGAALTTVRIELVARHYFGLVVDVGIGGGRFVREHGNASGWDVNPSAVRWLFSRGQLCDPRAFHVAAATFWDSLEHMRDPSEILRNVERWAFISTPIYESAEHALASKHYKPGEHLWYFSEPGLVAFMDRLGFQLREANDLETACGREGIGSFAFERV